MSESLNGRMQLIVREVIAYITRRAVLNATTHETVITYLPVTLFRAETSCEQSTYTSTKTTSDRVVSSDYFSEIVVAS